MHKCNLMIRFKCNLSGKDRDLPYGLETRHKQVVEIIVYYLKSGGYDSRSYEEIILCYFFFKPLTFYLIFFIVYGVHVFYLKNIFWSCTH